MSTNTDMDSNKVVYPDLSYKIVGLLFELYNKLGGALKEKHYQRGLSQLFKEKGIKFQEQYLIPIELDGKLIGKYLFDFLIDDKIVLEIKIGPVRRAYYDQLNSYLKTSGKKLGILAIFTEKEVKFRRILNLY